MRTPCGHHFHQDCLDRYLLASNKQKSCLKALQKAVDYYQVAIERRAQLSGEAGAKPSSEQMDSLRGWAAALIEMAAVKMESGDKAAALQALQKASIHLHPLHDAALVAECARCIQICENAVTSCCPKCPPGTPLSAIDDLTARNCQLLTCNICTNLFSSRRARSCTQLPQPPVALIRHTPDMNPGTTETLLNPGSQCVRTTEELDEIVQFDICPRCSTGRSPPRDRGLTPGTLSAMEM